MFKILEFIQMYTKTAFAYGDDKVVLLENLKINYMKDIDSNINFKNIGPYIKFQLSIEKNCIDSSTLSVNLVQKTLMSIE